MGRRGFRGGYWLGDNETKGKGTTTMVVDVMMVILGLSARAHSTCSLHHSDWGDLRRREQTVVIGLKMQEDSPIQMQYEIVEVQDREKKISSGQ